jgi:hypothetical protein
VQTYTLTQKLTLNEAIQYRDLCISLQHIGLNDILAYISETYLIDISKILREPTRLSKNYIIDVCENSEQEFEEEFSDYEEEASYNGYELKKVSINLEVLLNIGIVGFLIKNLDREIVFHYVSDSYYNCFNLTIQSKGKTILDKDYKGVYEMLRDKDFSDFLKTGYEYIPLMTE